MTFKLRRLSGIILLVLISMSFGDIARARGYPVLVNIENVPYIHQTYDTAEDFDGRWACGAASTVMVTAYYGKLDIHSITRPNPVTHTNDYSYYVSNEYTNNYGYTYSRVAPSRNGVDYPGAFGYIHYPYGAASGSNAVDYLNQHDLDASVIISPTESQVKAELDAGHPVIASTKLTPSGHWIVIKGYTDDGYYVVNDPWGNYPYDDEEIAGWGEFEGSDVLYTWSEMKVDEKYAVFTQPRSVIDHNPPTVNSFSVSPSSVTLGSSFTISYSVSDTGGSGLNRVELWRRSETEDWTEITRTSLVGMGDGPHSGSFSDVPPSTGTYWFGIHVVDNAENWAPEDSPINVEVNPPAPTSTYLALDIQPSATVIQGYRVEFWARLFDSSGRVVLGKTLKFYVAGVYVGQDNNPTTGWCRVPYTANLSPGSYDVNVVFEGDSEYKSSFKTSILTLFRARHQLTIQVSGSGMTNPAPGITMYDEGVDVSVDAIPDSGWTLDHWELGGVNVGSDDPITVTMNSDYTLTAVFALASADAGTPPGTYVEIFWEKSENYNFDMDLEITDAPEGDVQVLFWSHQFGFVNGEGGYIGLQIVGSEKNAIFSIWGAVDGTPGGFIEEDGSVWRSLINYDWKLNNKYRLRIWALAKEENGDEWWIGAVYDYATGIDTIIGTILVPASWEWLSSYSVTWIEYAGYESSDVPYTRAIFSNHYARHAEVDSPPENLRVNYGISPSLYSDVDYYGGTTYALEAGNSVVRDTPEGLLTLDWSRELTVSTDKTSYLPGELVTISGTASFDTLVNIDVVWHQLGVSIFSDTVETIAGIYETTTMIWQPGIYTVFVESQGVTDSTEFTVESGPPTLHHIFYGDVLIGGFPAPDETIVDAFIGDVWHSWTTTLNGEYNLHVQGDDPSTSVDEGGVDGDLIVFYLWFGNDSYVYAGSYYFDSGAETYLDLVCEGEPAPDVTVTTDKPVYAPDEIVTISGTAGVDALVAIDVKNPTATSIFLDTVTATAGVYLTAFRLPLDAMLGTYTVYVSTTGYTDETTFTVEETGNLSITTIPVNGAVSVNGTSWGTAPQSRIITVGDYNVTFGAMEGYVTPESIIVTVVSDATTEVLGVYTVVVPELPADTSGEETLDSTGAPKTSFAPGETVLASAEVSNAGTQSQMMLIIVQLKDPELRVLAPMYISVTLSPGQSLTPSMGFLLPTTGYATGIWTATIMVFDGWPAQGGVPIGSPVTMTFTVTS